MEKLYEDGTKEKTDGAMHILAIARFSDSLEVLLQNGACARLSFFLIRSFHLGTVRTNKCMVRVLADWAWGAEMVIDALVRVLKDEHKKSVELTTTLLQIFYWCADASLSYLLLFFNGPSNQMKGACFVTPPSLPNCDVICIRTVFLGTRTCTDS